MARPKKVTPQVPGNPVEPETVITPEGNQEAVIVEEPEKLEVAEPEQAAIVAPAPAKPAEDPKQSIKPVLTDLGYSVKG